MGLKTLNPVAPQPGFWQSLVNWWNPRSFVVCVEARGLARSPSKSGGFRAAFASMHNRCVILPSGVVLVEVSTDRLCRSRKIIKLTICCSMLAVDWGWHLSRQPKTPKLGLKASDVYRRCSSRRAAGARWSSRGTGVGGFGGSTGVEKLSNPCGLLWA